MNTALRVSAALLVGVLSTSIAQGQKLSCVKDVQYNKEFLAKYPDAGAACQEVKVIAGQKWARFNAEVKGNVDSHITVDFLNSSSKPMENPLTFVYTPDATLTLDNGKAKAASNVKKGEKVVVWVPESRFGIYAQPGSVDNERFRLASDESSATKQR
jgi:hypothetical protein